MGYELIDVICSDMNAERMVCGEERMTHVKFDTTVWVEGSIGGICVLISHKKQHS